MIGEGLEQTAGWNAHLHACPDCDLIHSRSDLKAGEVGHCRRCGAVLFHEQENSLDRSLAFAVSGLVFFLLANFFPLLVFEMNGNIQTNRLIDGSLEFLNTGYWLLAVVVFVSSFLAPVLILIILVSILLPMKFGQVPIFPETQIRLLVHLRPWAMAEIFVLGIVVAFVKLGDYADVSVGLSLFAFVMMVAATVLSYLTLDKNALWYRLGELRRL